MYLLRQARMDDLDAIAALAAYLDSPNLPEDRAFLKARLERSERAFAQGGSPSVEREYQFVLIDATDAVVGTAVILSKHGTPGMPHVFLRVCEERREASTLQICVHHRTLQLGATEDGPSEVGALVVHPDLRGKPGSPGRLISWGRFAYVALHPDRFESRFLAEMRASLTPDGRNRFWEAFGRRFTGLSYAEADRRSATEKSFILDLFPDTPFYASLLDDEVASELGQVHPEARSALRLLEQAGFRFIGEIDPFDAGPFYGAWRNEILPVRAALHGVLGAESPGEAAPRAIVMSEHGDGFRAVLAPCEVQTDGICIPEQARERLGLQAGDPVSRSPLPPPRSAEFAEPASGTPAAAASGERA